MAFSSFENLLSGVVDFLEVVSQYGLQRGLIREAHVRLNPFQVLLGPCLFGFGRTPATMPQQILPSRWRARS